MLRRRSVSWLFQPERSEHPMKSIAAKGLPSSRFIEQQDAKTFSSRQLYGSLQGPQVPTSAYSY